MEATAAAQIAHGWAPAVEPWAWVLLFMVVFTAANLTAVKNFGEFEFWFASLKVGAIVVFLGLGVLAVLGRLPDTDPVGMTNLTGQGSYLPTRLGRCRLRCPDRGLFAFGGLEVVTIAAAETDDPARAVGRAVRSAVVRILFFYVGSMLVIVTVLPWTAQQAGLSPYVKVLDSIGVPSAAQIMNIVVFVALLSALNANLYGSSRMVFSLAERGGGAPGAAEGVGRLPGEGGRGPPAGGPGLGGLRVRLRTAQPALAGHRVPLHAQLGRRGAPVRLGADRRLPTAAARPAGAGGTGGARAADVVVPGI
ncbi:hypothetical protein SMICM304S_02775 [Streptomyces microflavus]